MISVAPHVPTIMELHKLEAHRLQLAGYHLLGIGSKRAAYGNIEGTHVIKVAIDEMGIFENINEFSTYNGAEPEDRSRMARCALLRNSILIMERVKEPHHSISKIVKARCNWAEKYNYQIGYNKKGRLVAYDYG